MESNEQNKLTNKTETEAWTHGTDWQLPEGKGEGVWVKDSEGIKQKTYIHTATEKGGGDRWRWAKTGKVEMKRDFT